eukprot:scaffold35960_cov59-Attheya_sp.AAC.1
MAVCILTISPMLSVKCSENTMNLVQPDITLLFVGSACPDFFHAAMAHGDRMMDTPPLVCPLTVAASPVFESGFSTVACTDSTVLDKKAS